MIRIVTSAVSQSVLLLILLLHDTSAFTVTRTTIKNKSSSISRSNPSSTTLHLLTNSLRTTTATATKYVDPYYNHLSRLNKKQMNFNNKNVILHSSSIIPVEEETEDGTKEEKLITSDCIAETCVFFEEENELNTAPKKNLKQKTIIGLTFFFILDYSLRKLFLLNQVTFPSMMAGCVMLFTAMITLQIVKPGLGDTVFENLNPSAGFLAKWLPVFFVPGLAMLPTVPSIGSTSDIMKVILHVVIGTLFSFVTTAYGVLGVRKFQGKIDDRTDTAPTTTPTTTAATTTKRVKPYSEKIQRNLLSGAAFFGTLSILFTKFATSSPFLSPIRTLFMLCTTIGSYVCGANLNPKITAIIHPLVISTSSTWLVLKAFATLIGTSTFTQVLQTYKVGNLSLLSTGAGDLLLYMLGPAVCSFAVAMYSRKRLLKENLLTVMTGMIISSAGGLISSAYYVKFINLTSSLLRISVLSRNVTTALTIAITQILGGNVPIACSVVVLEGIFGATIGIKFLNYLKIKDPVSRGLAISAGGQGLGVASVVHEVDAFPFAAINLILTAFCSSMLVSIPSFRTFLLNVALSTSGP